MASLPAFLKTRRSPVFFLLGEAKRQQGDMVGCESIAAERETEPNVERITRI